VIVGLSPAAIKSMTLPEFIAAQNDFARSNGKPDEAPSDEDFWAAVSSTPDRPSILH